jgi:hypothetical protein
VEMGRLRAGDELSIAHLRYRLEVSESVNDLTVADNADARARLNGGSPSPPPLPGSAAHSVEMALPPGNENPLAAAVREFLPASLADRCRIQVIVQMEPEAEPSPSPEGAQPCPSNSSP